MPSTFPPPPGAIVRRPRGGGASGSAGGGAGPPPPHQPLTARHHRRRYMDIRTINSQLGVSPQIEPDEVAAIVAAGYRSIICNRPDGEEAGQPPAAAIAEAAQRHKIGFAHIPVVSGQMTGTDAMLMANAWAELPSRVLAYCRSGSRSEKLAAMAAERQPRGGVAAYDVVIVGGGSAGIATAASLLKRSSKLSIAIIEPSEVHYYKPGWTMVGAGIFDAEFTRHSETSVMPRGVDWIKKSATGFEPDGNRVLFDDRSEEHTSELQS